MSPIEQFISEIETFLVRTKMSVSLFGDLACNDRMFVHDLRRGREPRFSTMEKVRRFMADHGTRPPDASDRAA